MPTRPNPTQTRHLDAVTLRRELKQLLPSEVALDQAELQELLDFSNAGGRYEVLRRKLLRRAFSQLGAGDVLTDAQRGELIRFHEGAGPRPAFARLVTRDGHFFGESMLPPGEQRPAASAPGPVEDPEEPGRYVQPSGRFALGGVDER